MNFPEELKYTSEHEWIRVEGEVAYIGITEHAQNQLGDIVFVDIPTVGEELNAGDVFGTIEVVKTISDLFMPVSGTILEQNEALEKNLSWLIRIPTVPDGLLRSSHRLMPTSVFYLTLKNIKKPLMNKPIV